MPAGLPGSVENAFHQTRAGAFVLTLRSDTTWRSIVAFPWLQRAMGVIDLPATGRQSHCFCTRLDQQVDALRRRDQRTGAAPCERAVDCEGSASNLCIWRCHDRPRGSSTGAVITD